MDLKKPTDELLRDYVLSENPPPSHEDPRPQERYAGYAKDYEFAGDAGEGGTGKVEIVRYVNDLYTGGRSEYVARKKISKSKVTREQFLQEIAFTNEADYHLHLLRIQAIYCDNQFHYAIMDKADLDLAGYIEYLQELREGQDSAAYQTALQNLFGSFYCLTDALAHLHREGVKHRDIKPENILVKAAFGGEFQVALADFGIAANTFGLAVAGNTGHFATARYVPPEMVKPDKKLKLWIRPGKAGDIWSMGCVFYEMLTAITQPIYEGNPLPHVVQCYRREFTQSAFLDRIGAAQLQDDPPFDSSYSFALPAIIKVVMQDMMLSKPCERIKAEDLLEKLWTVFEVVKLPNHCCGETLPYRVQNGSVTVNEVYEKYKNLWDGIGV